MTDLCTACNDAPPFVAGMSLCRACLRAKVDADRVAREKAAALRHWQAPLTESASSTKERKP
jgi:hypothetical protein